MKTKKLPKGKHIEFDDDLVRVYDNNNEIVFQGEFDYCEYNDEPLHWNEEKCYYELPNDYKMICLK